MFVGFDVPVTAQLLLFLIRSLETLGFPVRAVTSDMGPKNTALWRELGVSYEDPGLTNPSNPERYDIVTSEIHNKTELYVIELMLA